MGTLKFIFKRFLWFILVIIGLLTITFIITNLIPADPARYFAGPDATLEQVNELKRRFGLDLPLYQQFLRYVNRLLHGDLGIALHTRKPVLRDIMNRFPATLELALISIFFAIILGIASGIVSAIKKDKMIDNLIRLISIVGNSAPSFWLSLVFIYILYFKLGLLPSGGRIGPEIEFNRITGLYLIDSIITMNWPAFSSSFYHLILPALTLSFVTLSSISRMTRSSMLEVLSQDYIKTARAKGISYYKVIIKHALRNALIPISTIISLTFGNILGGSVLIEQIFRWPGMGLYAAKAILTTDFPAIMGTTLFIAIIYILVNLINDILYIIIDPRLKRG